MNLRQATFADLEYDNRKRTTRKDKFLNEMNKVTPWNKIVEIIAPFYHTERTRGRKPKDLLLMIKMYYLQIWYGLSDEKCEDEIYDSLAFQQFLGIDFSSDVQVPDATTLENFRHLVEENKIGEKLQDLIVCELDEKGLIMHGGTIVDATIQKASSSTKNKDKKRDPEMKSTKKGNNYYFGAKHHIGTDAGSGAVVNVTTTAANTADITEAVKCFRDDDDTRYMDSGYIGVEKREEVIEFDEINKDKRSNEKVDYKIVPKPSRMKEVHKYPNNLEKDISSRIASIRCKVEHPFHIAKNIFKYKKCIYKGIAKNHNRALMIFSSVNLYMFRSRLAT